MDAIVDEIHHLFVDSIWNYLTESPAHSICIPVIHHVKAL